jgi:hypothetical protein
VLSNGSDVQFVTVKAEAYSIAATWECLKLHGAMIINHWRWHGSFFPPAAKRSFVHECWRGKSFCSWMLFMDLITPNSFAYEFCHIKFFILFVQGARGSVVGWGTMLKVPMGWIFSIDLILPAALWPSGPLRNEYQESSWG